MGHTLGDASTYVRYYMTDYTGVKYQAIVFGSRPQKDVVELMGGLSIAPTHVAT